MLRSNRLLFSALGVVGLLTVFIGVWTWPEVPALVSYGEANPRNDHYRSGGEQCQPSNLSAISNSGQRARKTDACREKAEEYRQATNDLIQQTRAADGAQAQADIASQQLWTGWLQTIGGLLTLAAAVGAAIYARDAAKQTRAGNQLALDVNRPWVTLSVVPQLASRDFKGGLYFRAEISAKNIGQMVATHFNVRYTLLFKARDEDEAAFDIRIDEIIAGWRDSNRVTAGHILPPSAVDKMPYWTPIEKADLVAHKIVSSVEIAYPVLLVAALYRVSSLSRVKHVSWQAFRINSIEDDGKPISGLRLDREFDANGLGVAAVTGLIHEESSADDDKHTHATTHT